MTRPAFLPLAFVFVAGLALAGCASTDERPAAAAAAAPVSASQPRLATYSCADGGNIRIENLGTAIRLLSVDGSVEEYPAAPAGQMNRYGDGPNAIVIEGSDALVMHGNQPPLTCTR